MRHRGFTLVEALAVAAGLLVLVAVAAPVLGQPRRAGRFTTSQDNLRFWGVAARTYTMDYAGLMPAYSWQEGETYHVEGAGDLFLASQGSVHLWQETDLLRRLTGRATGANRIQFIPQSGPQPHRRRTHLVMADHLGLGPTDRRAADPQDRNQLLWQRDPLGFEASGPWPLSTTDDDYYFDAFPAVQRWPYSSSYQVVPASYSWDVPFGSHTTTGPYPSTCNLFSGSTLPRGNRHDGEVAFPSGKVFMFEWHDRHSAAQDLWYAYPHARSNKLLFDGSVHDRTTGEAGLGFNPNHASNPDTFYYRYTRLTTDPPEFGDPLKAYPVSFRFTRDGLGGIDYAP